MSDFVDYEPGARSSTAGPDVRVRAANAADVHGLAAVMSVRGDTLDGHLVRAGLLLERLPVLLVAEKGGVLVGWSGVQMCLITTDAAPEWLVAGLTVVPEQRRRGIAARLLRGVLRATAQSAPGEAVFSAINIRNPASIELHEGLGFVEVSRGAHFAGISFSGGEGVLLKHP